MKLGAPIVFDLYPRALGSGYHFDLTRTWCLGHAPQGVQSLHADVKSVYEKIFDLMAADVSPRELQLEACRAFEARGHATLRQQPLPESGYLHGLGHGLGLEIHEAPKFRHYETQQEFPLQAGMVVTLEPGLYYPGKGAAVRLEDTLLIRADGTPEVLVPYPHDLVLPLRSP